MGGFNHSLALTADGKVYAWGLNSNGQLGDGTTTQRITPVQVSSITGHVALAQNALANVLPPATIPAPPTIQAGTTGWTNQFVTVTIQYPSDATTKEYRINGGAWQTYTGSITMTTNGTIEARAVDAAGNATVSSYTVSNIQAVQVTPPTAHILPDTLMFDVPTGTTVYVKLNQGTWQAYAGPIVLPDGLYDVEVKAVDGEGNESQVLRMSVTMYGEQLFRVQQLLQEAITFKTQAAFVELDQEVSKIPNEAEEKPILVQQVTEAKVEVAKEKVEQLRQDPTPEKVEEAKSFLSLLPNDVEEKSDLSFTVQSVEKQLNGEENDNSTPSDEGGDTPTDASHPFAHVDTSKMSNEALIAWRAIQRAEKYPADTMLKYAYKKALAVATTDAHKQVIQEYLAHVQEQYDARKTGTKSAAVVRAETRVKALEKMYSPLLLKKAQDAVNALPDGDDKELLQARIDQVVQAQEVAKVQKQVEDATKAVERAESTKVKSDIDRATQLVSALPDGETKQTLLSRLDALKQVTDPAVTKVMEAINLAKKYSKVSYYYKRAVELINQVQDEAKREELMALLNAQ